MARLEIRRKLGDPSTLVGAINAEPALGFAERMAINRIGDAAAATADHARETRDAVAQGMLVVHRSIERLDADLGFRIDRQTEVLARQLEILGGMAETLRTPARTRAAEQMQAAAELLRRGRYERALTAASRAADDDPNNPAGFGAQGWALIGLERLDEARTAFAEQADACDGLDRIAAIQRVARLTFELDGPEAALAKLPTAGVAEDASVTVRERQASVDFDAAVFLAAAGEVDAASDRMAGAIGVEARHGLAALRVEAIARHDVLTTRVDVMLQEALARCAEWGDEAAVELAALSAELVNLERDAARASGRISSATEGRLLRLRQGPVAADGSMAELVAGYAADGRSARLHSLRADLRCHREEIRELRASIDTVLTHLQREQADAERRAVVATLADDATTFALQHRATAHRISDAEWRIVKDAGFFSQSQAWTMAANLSNGRTAVVKGLAPPPGLELLPPPDITSLADELERKALHFAAVNNAVAEQINETEWRIHSVTNGLGERRIWTIAASVTLGRIAMAEGVGPPPDLFL